MSFFFATHHTSFIIQALFHAAKFLRPNPPYFLSVQTMSHEINGGLLYSADPPKGSSYITGLPCQSPLKANENGSPESIHTKDHCVDELCPAYKREVSCRPLLHFSCDLFHQGVTFQLAKFAGYNWDPQVSHRQTPCLFPVSSRHCCCKCELHPPQTIWDLSGLAFNPIT